MFRIESGGGGCRPLRLKPALPASVGEERQPLVQADPPPQRPRAFCLPRLVLVPQRPDRPAVVLLELRGGAREEPFGPPLLEAASQPQVERRRIPALARTPLDPPRQQPLAGAPQDVLLPAVLH